MLSITSSCPKIPIWAAIEDGLTVMAYTFVAGLMATGNQFPPPVTVLYATGLSSTLAFIVAYAHARHIIVTQIKGGETNDGWKGYLKGIFKVP